MKVGVKKDDTQQTTDERHQTTDYGECKIADGRQTTGNSQRTMEEDK